MLRIGLLLAALFVITAGFLLARYFKTCNAVAYFFTQLTAFVVLTVLLFNAGVVPYRIAADDVAEPWKLLTGALKIIWWLGAAWLAVGFLNAFVVMSRQPREAKLLQDLLAGLIYVGMSLAICGYVFDWPVKGLVATSGAVAVILGLALQNSLGDVFSAIVLDIERPYRVGDWIILDDAFQGQVIETNWRSTHVMTGNQDVAIIPNSLIAKSKLVNCSVPTKLHGASLRIKLAPSCSPAFACQLLNEVLLSSRFVLQTPKPSVTIQDISAETLDLQLSYTVSDVGAVGDAQNDLFDRVFRAIAAAGLSFAVRLDRVPAATRQRTLHSVEGSRRLLAGISLFSGLTPDEIDVLASHMVRREYDAGQLIARSGTVLQSLCIVGSGVIVGSKTHNGHFDELGRLAAGEYFGENGLLTAEPLNADITALTRTTLFEIPRESVTQLLTRRPSISEELSDTLARRRVAMQSFDQPPSEERHRVGLVDRLAVSIRRLFAEHQDVGLHG